MEGFYSELAVILDVPAVTPDDELKHFENWDSLTMLSICALVDSKYCVSVNAVDLHGCDTAGDLAVLVSRRLTR